MKKRIWSLLLAAMLLLSVCGGAMAGEIETEVTAVTGTRDSYDSAIQAHAPTIAVDIVLPDETGDPTITAYRIMDITWSATSGSPSNYVWVQAVSDWLDNAGSSFKGEYGDANNLDDQMDADQFYTALGVALAALPEGSIEKTTGNSFTGSLGQYLVIVTGGVRVYSPFIVGVLPEWKGTAWGIKDLDFAIKSSGPSLDKKINEETNTSTLDRPDQYDTASIGDTINFDIRSDIPTYPAGASNTQYDIGDVMSAGLTLDTGSIQVFGVNVITNEDGTTTDDPNEIRLAEITNYDLKIVDDQNFTVEFHYNTIANYEKIHIDYNATLNAQAIIGREGEDPYTYNDNTATLYYSNNPYALEDPKTMVDEVKVYTYGLQVEKVDAENNTTKLKDAVFNLHTATVDEDGDATRAQRVYFTLSNGVYTVAGSTIGTPAPDGYTFNLTTDEDGLFNIEGLDEGTYLLQETIAPQGYNLMANDVEIDIAEGDQPWQVVDATGAIKADVVVLNSTGPTLPSTGGMGTTLFTIIGIALMAAVVVILVVMSRKKNKEAE